MRLVLFAAVAILAVTGLRAAYDKVQREIASPDSSARLEFHGAPVQPPDFSAINNMMSKPLPGAQDGGFASSIVTQNQQFNNRMEDLRNYARNPAGWHGTPPH